MFLKNIFIYLSCVSPISYTMNRYSKKGDKLVNKILDKYSEDQATLGEYTIKFPDSFEIWSSNFPYSYGYLRRGNGSGDFRVKTKTRYRVRKLQLSLENKRKMAKEEKEERERDAATASLK